MKPYIHIEGRVTSSAAHAEYVIMKVERSKSWAYVIMKAQQGC